MDADKHRASMDTSKRRDVAFASFATEAYKSNDKIIFIVDTAAERHIVNDIGLIVNPKPSAASIKTGDDTVCYAEAEGDVVVMDGSANTRRMVLTNALYIPGFAANLFSTERARASGVANFLFHANGCTIIDRSDGSTIYEAPNGPDGRLAVIESSVALPKAYATPEEWHYRYGHLSYSALKTLADKEMVTGINTVITDTNKVCAPCAIGKSTRLPFGASTTSYTVPLELVSMDVMGPFGLLRRRQVRGDLH
jgi:hypothetical protein